jgi:hypothetical protein
MENAGVCDDRLSNVVVPAKARNLTSPVMVVGVGDHTVAASCSSGCEAEIHDKLDRNRQLDLADIGLRLAKRAGASYADIRIGRNCHEHIEAREEAVGVCAPEWSMPIWRAKAGA